MQPVGSSPKGPSDDLGSLFLRVGVARPPHHDHAPGDARRPATSSHKGRADLGSLFLRVGMARPPHHSHAPGDAIQPATSSRRGLAEDLGSLFLRVGLGVVFAWHGWLKFNGGVEHFAAFLGSLNVPLPEVVAWLQVIAEGIGGLLLVAGIFTRCVSLALMAVVLGAVCLVKVDVGFIVPGAAGAELETALLAGLLGLLFIGPGQLSLDRKLGR